MVFGTDKSRRTERPTRSGSSRWVYTGVGIPKTRDGVKLSYVAMIPIVALTIWGYVDVSGRGRIQAGNLEAHKTDFTVFTEAGAAFFDGRDPYLVTNPRGWFYLYPPLFALLVSPIAILDSQSQVVVWYAISAVLGFGCYSEARKLLRLVAASEKVRDLEVPEASDPSDWIAVSAGLAVFLPALDCLQRGQLGIALVYPLMVGFRLAVYGRAWTDWWFGGIVLAWPVVVKLIPALPVAVLLLQQWTTALGTRRAPSSAGRAAAVTMGLGLGGILFVLVIPAACIGWEKNLHHLHTWVNRVATNQEVGQEARFHIDSVRNQSLGNAAHLFAARARGFPSTDNSGEHWLAVDRATIERRQADHVTRWLVHIARATVLVLLVFVAVKVSLQSDELGSAASYGLASLATLLISPLAWGHYYVFALPVVLFVPLWMVQRGHPGAAKVLAAGLPALIWMHYLAMSWCGPFGLLGLGTTVWFLSACVIAIVILGRSTHPKAAISSGMRCDIPHDFATGNHLSISAALAGFPLNDRPTLTSPDPRPRDGNGLA